MYRTILMATALTLGLPITSTAMPQSSTATSHYMTGEQLKTVCGITEQSNEMAKSLSFSCSGYLMAFLDMARVTHVVTNHTYRTYEPVFCIPDEKLPFQEARQVMEEGLKTQTSILKKPASEVLARIFKRQYPCDDKR